MLKQLKYLPLCIIAYLFLSFPILATPENLITLSLNLKYRALYITCCDFEGTGLKDIATANEYTITIFRQNPNYSFKDYTIKSSDRITALNSCRINKSGEKVLICLGINKIFYFYLNNYGEVKGPNYIELPKDKIIFLEKQKSMKNYSFVVDLNNDGLDDIAIPLEDSLLVLWQIESLVFKPSFVQIEDNFIDSSLNSQPWPKFGEKNGTTNKGISFFPTLNKGQYYWFQDYNKDGLLDIISLTGNPDGCQIAIYFQKKKGEFQLPKHINLLNTKYQNWCSGELQLLDLNNDGLLDIIETNIEYPLRGNTSFLPIIVTKIYLASDPFQFNSQPNNIFKSVFIPGLDNIVRMNNNGGYGIITAPSPLKLGSKESIIRVAENKEIIFNLGYYTIDDKAKNKYISYVALNKDFSMVLPELTGLDNFRQFIRFEDINDDGIPDILSLKKINLLELATLKKVGDALAIDRTLDIPLPYPITEVKTIDINSDRKREFLMLGPSSKKIYVIYLRGL